MWSVHCERLGEFDGLHYRVECGAMPASFCDVVDAWRNNANFRDWFNEVLAAVPFNAFRWEAPAVTRATEVRQFEFVVLNSPDLSRRPDRKAFAEHFERTDCDAVAFPNLGADALLVAPLPIAANRCYGHLASFAREAPAEQQAALWALVGGTMDKRISDKPVWLSTAGAGVSWLHVRLDDQPKYYVYSPYRRIPCLRIA